MLKPIPGHPGYSVTEDGRVWSEARGGRWLKPCVAGKGHLWFSSCVGGKRTPLYIHRAVLLTYVGPCPDGMEACHGDGDPTNNHLSNLRWDTKNANQVDKLRHGRHNKAKLTEDQVRSIRQHLSARESKASIARRYGVSESTVRFIQLGTTWKHVV